MGVFQILKIYKDPISGLGLFVSTLNSLRVRLDILSYMITRCKEQDMPKKKMIQHIITAISVKPEKEK
jgi:hypothetical protein